MNGSPILVAEIGPNHLGDLGRARDLVHAAHEAGADMVKFQTWAPDTMCLDPSIQAPPPWSGSLRDLYRECWTPWEWHAELFDIARKLGIEPFSAAFDHESVDFLETLGVKRHKVASFEACDTPLIEHMAATGKPLIISTGTASLAEIDRAFGPDGAPAGDVWTLLHCVSSYPTPVREASLLRIGALRAEFGCNVGLSDHSLGAVVAVSAAALGATMIEKHFTLKRSDGGPDAAFSMEPQEFAQMVRECRDAAAACSTAGSGLNVGAARLNRSLWVACDIPAGQRLRLGVNIRTARPNLGMPCNTDLAGLVTSRPLQANTPLRPEDTCPYP